MDMNSLTKAHSASNNRDGRLNTECEINNRSAANLRLNISSVVGQTLTLFHIQKYLLCNFCKLFEETFNLKLKACCANKKLSWDSQQLTISFICILITSECQYNRDRPYVGVKDEEDDEALEDDDGDGARGGGRDSDGSGSSRRSSLGGDEEYAQKVHRLQTAKQKLRQLQELVAMVQVRI